MPEWTPSEAADAAWWRSELVRFNARARQWLKRKFPSIQRLHEDLASETLLQLAAHLSQRPAGLPVAWFRPEEPAEEDVRRFEALALAVLNRRVMDHFRADFRKWARELPVNEEQAVGQVSEEATAGTDAAGALDLARAARALMVLLAELPDRDRMLMEELALGGRDGPLEDVERQRVHRLRARLLNALRARLGHDPLELLRQL